MPTKSKFLRPEMSKLNRAMRVLRAVRIPAKVGRWAGVNAFNNCREQGYTLIVSDTHRPDRWFTFSEYRNTDEIVVYSGRGFPPPTGVDDASYADKRFFPSEREAAAFISREASGA